MSSGVNADAPAMAAGEEFRKCTTQVRNLLDHEQFRADDFWKGYKLYCFAHYSGCDTSKRFFGISKMGRIMRSLQNRRAVPWGTKFDAAIREVWAMMEEYVWVRHGKDCTNLRALMGEFDDVKKLSACKNGSLLLRVIEDDKHGTEGLHREALRVKFSTDIFDDVRASLKRADLGLAQLANQPRVAKRVKHSHRAKRQKK